MAARISFADLSDATGIPADLLAAEVVAMMGDGVTRGDPERVPQTPPALPARASLPPAESSVDRAA